PGSLMRNYAFNRKRRLTYSGPMEEANAHGAIWDMDGTLVDTAELHFAAWLAIAKELNLPFTRDDFAATFGKRNPEILRQLYNDRFSENEIAEFGEQKDEN